MKNVLILGKVWPEPTSSAAGTRLLQLMEIFKAQGCDLYFASPAQRGEFSFDPEPLQIEARVLPINDSEADDYFKSLQPDIVLFDRFTTEEQFGWRLSKVCPDCIKILDTEDLHSLRAERQKAVKKNVAFDATVLLTSEIAMREIASMYRCDLSLIISKVEMELLTTVFKIDDSLLHYIPLFIPDNKKKPSELPSFEKREHFISIGNFLHDPNRDSVNQLHDKIWPHVRKKLPHAQLHVYGAYADDQVRKLHNEKTGFLIKGRAGDVSEVMKNSKVCLAYLRFGAGLKGKLQEAMINGTPSVTSSIGIEGMGTQENWAGAVEDDYEKFAEAAVQLYSDKTEWEKKQKKIPELLKQFDQTIFTENFVNEVSRLSSNLEDHRKNNFIGSMLQHHSAQSTRYMALWIEAKNRVALDQKSHSD